MVTSGTSEISHGYFQAICDVIAKVIGPDHPCTKYVLEARRSSMPSDIKSAIDMVRALPTALRDQVFLTAKAHMKDDARAQSWLMEISGSPTDIPPDRTNH